VTDVGPARRGERRREEPDEDGDVRSSTTSDQEAMSLTGDGTLATRHCSSRGAPRRCSWHGWLGVRRLEEKSDWRSWCELFLQLFTTREELDEDASTDSARRGARGRHREELGEERLNGHRMSSTRAA
jgi:hypothetical protein